VAEDIQEATPAHPEDVVDKISQREGDEGVDEEGTNAHKVLFEF
jgi:hypothetical protein